MGDSESVEALAKRLGERNQRLDALVNNAGVYQGPARQIWDVNEIPPSSHASLLRSCNQSTDQNGGV
jgi:NAD(P)-dependent dehydrogenase (short-subunit alcohol dehydrogenase family)